MEDPRPTKAGLLIGCLGILFVCFIISLPVMGWPFKTVEPGEAMIVQRFGQIRGGVRNEGFYFEPIAKGIKYNVKEQALQTQETAASKDLQDINIDITVNYKYDSTKIREIYTTLGDPEQVMESIIKPRVSARLKAETTKYDAESLLQNRTEVTEKVRTNLAEELQGYNVIVTGVELKNIAFANAEFNTAIENKQIAEQKALQAKHELETTKVEAEKKVAAAKGEAEAQRLQQQTLTPQVLQKLYLDKWNGTLPQTLVTDGESNIFIQGK